MTVIVKYNICLCHVPTGYNSNLYMPPSLMKLVCDTTCRLVLQYKHVLCSTKERINNSQNFLFRLFSFGFIGRHIAATQLLKRRQCTTCGTHKQGDSTIVFYQFYHLHLELHLEKSKMISKLHIFNWPYRIGLVVHFGKSIRNLYLFCLFDVLVFYKQILRVEKY